MAIIAVQRDAKGGNMREIILEAARRRFQRFGPRKTTMEEVAKEASCSRATVYAHFPGKEKLYAALLEADAESFIRDAEAILSEGKDTRVQLRSIVELTRATYTGNHVLRHAVAGDEEMNLECVAAAFTRNQEARVIGLLKRVLERGVADGTLRSLDPERVGYLIFHLGSLLINREAAGIGDYPFDEIVALMDEIFARGIGRV